MSDLQCRGLLSSILGRLPACSHDELRVLDLALDRLEHDREHTPARIADTLDAIGGELVRWAGRVLAERDQDTDGRIADLAAKIHATCAQPNRMAIPLDRVNVALAAGLDVEWIDPAGERGRGLLRLEHPGYNGVADLGPSEDVDLGGEGG